MSAIPGRIRLQADPARRQTLTAVAEQLDASPHVTSTDLRAASRSVVVRFDPQHAAALADGLLEVGVDLRAAVERSVRASPPAAITAAATAGNRAVGQRLGGTDLRTLIPLGLGLLAARRVMRGEERLADAPWYVLAWYASETFFKFHGNGGGRGHVVDSEGE